jgi:hypothetical protein
MAVPSIVSAAALETARDQMPIGHLPVFGGILGHRGDYDAIGQFQVADLYRRKQHWVTHKNMVVAVFANDNWLNLHRSHS